MSDTQPPDPRVLARLREWVGADASEMSDEQLLEITSGSLFRAGLDLELAASDMAQSIKAAIAEDWRRLRERALWRVRRWLSLFW